MGVAHVGLVHRDPCECKVKDFPTVSSIERNESERRHLQGVRHFNSLQCIYLGNDRPTSFDLNIGRCSILKYELSNGGSVLKQVSIGMA